MPQVYLNKWFVIIIIKKYLNATIRRVSIAGSTHGHRQWYKDGVDDYHFKKRKEQTMFGDILSNYFDQCHLNKIYHTKMFIKPFKVAEYMKVTSLVLPFVGGIIVVCTE